MIKNWYTHYYETDELGQEINSMATFNDLHRALLDGKDVYEVIGVGDSLVRERLFDELAILLGVSYDDVYNMWLNN